MSTGTTKRTRSERVASVTLPPGTVRRVVGSLRRGEVLLRLALSLLAAVILWAATAAWAPPLEYRQGQVPARDVVAKVEFERVDPKLTEEARDRARSLAYAVYDQDATPLEQLRARLQNEITRLGGAESLVEFGRDDWAAFEPQPPEGVEPPDEAEREARFQRFRDALAKDQAREQFKEAVAGAVALLEQNGLMDEPQHQEGNQEKIFVRPDKTGFEHEVEVASVLTESAGDALRKRLHEKLQPLEDPRAVVSIADRVYAWLRPKLPTTLTLNKELTAQLRQRAVEKVEPVLKHYPEGSTLAEGGQPLTAEKMALLRDERAALLAKRPLVSSVARSLAVLGMFVALYTLCGFYLYHREPALITNMKRFFSLLGLVVACVILAQLLARNGWNAELIPLLLFGMTIAIAYHQELAILLSSAVALVIVFSVGLGLPEIVILTAGVAATILLLRSVRSRSKLVYVGLASAVAVLLTTLGVGTLAGQPFFTGTLFGYQGLLWDSMRYAMWAVIAGSLMTCLLPFIERLFDVQTDISLIELGDPAHPLLQELARRAPGTYNHSINVASLAEAAAEAIGSRSLLVRVGAYFHDIGKMLKPGYFVENQSQGDNRHESLVPAMSTLVIIAHVKDGADLARQHGLPDRIIDFIQQHHGTTLVEYFYRRASEQSEADPSRGDVDESAFRYPGPKPQTKEAGVLMLADAVESACRALTEPTPARIERLVKELAMKRLLDGQFDECGLTLQELRTVEDSLVKSLTAIYHGRVKYPDQRRA